MEHHEIFLACSSLLLRSLRSTDQSSVVLSRVVRSVDNQLLLIALATFGLQELSRVSSTKIACPQPPEVPADSIPGFCVQAQSA